MNLAPSSVVHNSSVCKVLTIDELLGKLLSHLHCPACFVRAALTSRSWLLNASSKATIRDFRSRQSPRLLGIYVTSDGFWKPDFVPLPDASSPELAAAVRHGNFGFDDIHAFPLRVWDCRNHRVLYGTGEVFNADLVPAVRTPLRCAGEDTAVFPSPPLTAWPHCPHAMLLPDEGDNVSCYSIDITHHGQMVHASVFALQAGSWTTHCSAMADLSRQSATIPRMTLLMSGKIYTMDMAGYILVLDLAAAKFSSVDLPKGVVFDYASNFTPCRGDDSVLYLIHLNGDKLTVWFQKMGDHGGAGSSAASNWVLKNTISVGEVCKHLVDKIWGPEEGEQGDVSVVGAGDNAEFVFLEFLETGVFVYIHLESREAKVVYQRHPDNDFLLRVHPFMMDWPPVFPERAGEGEGMNQE